MPDYHVALAQQQARVPQNRDMGKREIVPDLRSNFIATYSRTVQSLCLMYFYKMFIN